MSSTSKTRQQIADEYGISRRTLYRLLKRYKIELPPGVVLPETIERVYQVLGKPNRMDEDLAGME